MCINLCMFGIFLLQKMESWLLHLEETVHNAVYLCSMEAILAYEGRQRKQWVFDHPSQAKLGASQTWWVLDVEMASARLKENLATALEDCQVWISPFCLLIENKYSVKIVILV